MSRVFLTGATGFIGQYLVAKMPSIKRVTKRGNSSLSTDGIWYIDGVHSATNWNGAFNDIDVVIHLAGIAHSNGHTDENYHEVNALGTLWLARQAVNAGVKRFIFISTIGVNGNVTSGKAFKGTDEVNPQNSYAKSKLYAELGLQQISHETGLQVVIIRPTLVYGPSAPGNFGLLTKLVDKLFVLPFGLVNNKRSFISVHNLVDLIIVCTSHPKAVGQVFLASDGKVISTKEFINAIAEGLGKNVTQVPIPVFVIRAFAKLFGKATMAEQVISDLEVDSSNAFELLNWNPPYSQKEVMELLNRDVHD